MTLRHIPVKDGIYFITTSCFQRKPLLESSFRKKQLLEQLYYLRDRDSFYMFAFVIMNNHIHLIIQPSGKKTIPEIMKSLKGYMAKKFGKGKFWNRRYYSHTIRDEEIFAQKYNYIHHNPVKAGYCISEENYPFSSASGKWLTDLDQLVL